MKHLYILFGILFLGLSQSNLNAQTNHYVDQNATGSNNGSSWTNAYVDLQSALGVCTSGDSILVAEGVYYPTTTTNRGIYFVLCNNLVVFGGYPTGGGLRNWNSNQTILSGNIGLLNDSSDNSYHVIKNINVYQTEINGLIIKNGVANVANDTYGGGMSNTNSNIKINNCYFELNSSIDGGGGIYNYQSIVEIKNTQFKYNRSRELQSLGGAISNDYSTMEIYNCSFFGNHAGHGAGISQSNNTLNVSNCSFGFNESHTLYGGAIVCLYTNTAYINNSIFWKNVALGHDTLNGSDIKTIFATANVSYCLTQKNSSYSSGVGIVNNIDPLFENENDGNLRIQACSPLIDLGHNDSIIFNNNFDIDGNPRIYNQVTVDMGINEIQQSPIPIFYYKYYVDSAATAGGNGLSWNTAFNDLQDAFILASQVINCCAVDSILVAKGTYYPTYTSNRDISFVIPDNTVLLGGYNANTGLRNVNANPSILSGDIGILYDNTDNSYHIVYTNSVSNTTVLDGFTIEGGRSEGYGNGIGYGAGMSNSYSSIQIHNCNFINNYCSSSGAAMNNGEGCSIVITNCNFSDNVSNGSSSGILSYRSSTIITDCNFSDNTAAAASGGISISYGSSIITNCSFSGNSGERGGGISIYNCFSRISNCSFYNNESHYGGGIYIDNCSVIISNCSFYDNNATTRGGAICNSSSNAFRVRINNSIFWGNKKNGIVNVSEADIYSYSTTSTTLPSVTYCLTQLNSSYSTGLGIINNIDPVFVDANNGNLHIQACSPLIDRGNNDSIPAYITTDIDGNIRIFNGATVDMGINEIQQAPFLAYHYNLYVDSAMSSGGIGLSWNTAYNDLQSALERVTKTLNCSVADTIFVAKGTYFPTSSSDRFIRFNIPNNAVIMGGYNANTGIRDIISNPTILSGDIGVQNTNTDNSYHVIYTNNVSNATVLDGFIIKKGYAIYNGFTYSDHGGGLLNTSSSPTISNCIFCNNTAYPRGGGMANCVNSSPIITNCLFVDNISNYGAGIFNSHSSPKITNCSFVNNQALYGGGIYNNTSSPLITNTIFWENKQQGYNYAAGADIYPNNPSFSISYCITQLNSFYSSGIGNISNQNPLFIDSANRNFHLQACSPAIDAGCNDSIPLFISTDLGNNNRIYNNSIVDIGVFEYQGTGNYIINEYASMCDNGNYLLPDSTYVSLSGTYTTIFPRQNGCDSTIITNLAVYQSVFNVFDTICINDNYLLPNGSITNTQGVYTDTLISSRGCDSVIITNLAIYPAFFNVFDTICSNDNYQLPNGTLTNTQGVYIDTLVSSLGCDSIITTNLTVCPTSLTNVFDTICENNNYLLPNGTITNVQGVYSNTLLNYEGCDSIIITNLTVNSISQTNVFVTICGNNNYILPGGDSVNVQGIYTDTLINYRGCDSIITTNLTVFPASIINIESLICVNDSYILPNGTSTSIQGVYIDTFSNSYGCDSIIITDLEVFQIDTTITIVGNTMVANQDSAFYLWYDCVNHLLLTSQRAQTFIPTVSGSYSVIIAKNSCLDTTNCYNISIIGISEEVFSNNINIYPNPTENIVSIDLEKKYNDINIKVYSSHGQLLINKSFNDKQIIELDLSEIPTGVLHISITADNKNGNVKVVKM